MNNIQFSADIVILWCIFKNQNQVYLTCEKKILVHRSLKNGTSEIYIGMFRNIKVYSERHCIEQYIHLSRFRQFNWESVTKDLVNCNWTTFD